MMIQWYPRLWILVLSCLVSLLGGCAQMRPTPPEECTPEAGRLVENEQLPYLADDLDKASLLAGLDQSLDYWHKQEAGRMFEVCGSTYSAAWLTDSLKLFRKLALQHQGGELDRLVRENFDICLANADWQQGRILVTGYFQPRLKGSLVKQPPYVHPIYAKPPDLMEASSVDQQGDPKKILGRMENQRFVPYWSRAQIETQGVLAGQELLWLDDPLEAFILHVQGSGLVELTDGTVHQVLYAGSNGLPYRSIGRLLADEGRIPLEKMSLPAIRTYLQQHLDEQQRILHYNERFIFFRWGPAGAGRGPMGSMGRELTPGRSVALDSRCYPQGMLAFLESRQPLFGDHGQQGWTPLNRFVLGQDSGSAIKGPGRLDLFWGSAPGSEAAAGLMKEAGRLFFLLKKKP